MMSSSHYDTSEHSHQLQQSSSSPSAVPGIGIGGLPPVSPYSYYPNPYAPTPAVPKVEYIGAAGRGTVKERTWSEKIFYETGTCYASGVFGGGAMGALYGIQEAKEKKLTGSWRLMMNSVMNSASRSASTNGNRFGVFAAMFSLSRTLAKNYRDENDVKNDIIGFSAASLITSIPRLGLSGAFKAASLCTVAGGLMVLARVYYAENRDVNNPPPQWFQNLFTTFAVPPPMPQYYPYPYTVALPQK